MGSLARRVSVSPDSLNSYSSVAELCRGFGVLHVENESFCIIIKCIIWENMLAMINKRRKQLETY